MGRPPVGKKAKMGSAANSKKREVATDETVAEKENSASDHDEKLLSNPVQQSAEANIFSLALTDENDDSENDAGMKKQKVKKDTLKLKQKDAIAGGDAVMQHDSFSPECLQSLLSGIISKISAVTDPMPISQMDLGVMSVEGHGVCTTDFIRGQLAHYVTDVLPASALLKFIQGHLQEQEMSEAARVPKKQPVVMLSDDYVAETTKDPSPPVAGKKRGTKSSKKQEIVLQLGDQEQPPLEDKEVESKEVGEEEIISGGMRKLKRFTKQKELKWQEQEQQEERAAKEEDTDEPVPKSKKNKALQGKKQEIAEEDEHLDENEPAPEPKQSKKKQANASAKMKESVEEPSTSQRASRKKDKQPNYVEENNEGSDEETPKPKKVKRVSKKKKA